MNKSFRIFALNYFRIMSKHLKILSLLVLIFVFKMFFNLTLIAQVDYDSVIEKKNSEAKILYERGFYYEAESVLEELIELKKRYQPDDIKSIANTYVNLGIMHKLTYRTDKALEFYDQAEYIYKNLVDDPGRLATVYYNKSSLYLTRSDYYKAERYLNEVRAILDTIVVPFFF